MKTTEYKGYVIEHSKPGLGFFKSGRGGKVIRSFWVYHPMTPGFGKWCDSLASAKKWINEQVK